MAAKEIMTLYHVVQARSFRCLWTMHELGLKDYRLVTMPFPPRYLAPGYKKINVLGTIPYFTDGPSVKMTESCAIPVYLAEKYGQQSNLKVLPSEPDYAAYLNWIAHADATLTFPQTVYLRYCLQETKAGLGDAGKAYAKWFFARMALLNNTLSDGREFLCAGRFTIADICVSYALIIARQLELEPDYGKIPDLTKAYLDRLKERPAFQSACAEETESIKAWEEGRSKL
mmetsp:Transcript_18309/g.39453  ORF Transcript_18309/g.39453 Transcript_18309/m.39453 type:complete len:229 (+) Transcript_18309:93-779(+)